MTTTRSAAKKLQSRDKVDGVPSAEEAQPGSKHKAGDGAGSPSPKRTKERAESARQSAEETTDRDGTKQTQAEHQNGRPTQETEKAESQQPQPEVQKGGTSAVEPQGREGAEAPPSNILEKGIIYFFFRGRVDVDEPSGVSEIARSHIILRPIEKDAKLGSGPIGDAGNTRVFVIPKKTLPLSGRDRWTGFVEKSGASFPQIKEEFLASSDYETKTAGSRHTPAATPVGEGVYAITRTGMTSHLVYILTLPGELGEVQKEIGLKKEGSFIITTKNPEHPGPANARLPKVPEYPKEFFEEFSKLRWVPTEPKHLDYPNTQFLLVGESSGVEKALQPQKQDQDEGKAEPAEETEKLANEDTRRMRALSEDDSGRIFADLQVQAGDYPKLQTTF